MPQPTLDPTRLDPRKAASSTLTDSHPSSRVSPFRNACNRRTPGPQSATARHGKTSKTLRVQGPGDEGVGKWARWEHFGPMDAPERYKSAFLVLKFSCAYLSSYPVQRTRLTHAVGLVRWFVVRIRRLDSRVSSAPFGRFFCFLWLSSCPCVLDGYRERCCWRLHGGLWLVSY